MPYTIVRLDRRTRKCLPRPEEPFEIIGRLMPVYDGQEWTLSEELTDTPREKTYPNDSYRSKEYIGKPSKAAFLAMLDGTCVGSLRVRKKWNDNAFIEDLAVDRAHRGRGVGTMLMDTAAAWCRENGLRVVSLETQDWNLLACRFYLKYGFSLGGIDQFLYNAYAPQRGETALYFYLFPEDLP